MIETILIGRPPVVTSYWKSTAHTRLGASAVTVSGAVEVPRRLRSSRPKHSGCWPSRARHRRNVIRLGKLGRLLSRACSPWLIFRSASLAAALARRGGGKMGTAFVRDPVIFLMP